MVAATRERLATTPKIAYDVTEVSEMLDVHRETVIDGIKTGVVRGFRFAGKGKWLIPRNELARLVDCAPEDLPD